MKEYDTFIEYMLEQGILLTRTRELLGGGALQELNEMMTYQVKDVTNKHPQYRFHLLSFFYHLSLGGLLVKKIKKGGKLYLVPTQRALDYLSLHDVEKYFFLLETLWIDTDWSFIERDYSSLAFSNLKMYLYYICQENVGEIIELKDSSISAFRYLHSSGYIANLLSSLGLIRMIGDTYHEKNYKRNVLIDSISLTHHGAYLSPILVNERDLSHWNWPNHLSLKPYISREDFLDGKEESFYETFLPHYPSLETTLSYDSAVSTTTGDYYFKVSIRDDIYRRIRLPWDANLDKLCSTIKEAFDFEEDASFAFIFKDSSKEDTYYYYPRVRGHLQADIFSLGELNLYPKKTFILQYDFHEDWRFLVEVEKIEEGEESPPAILERVGESPDKESLDDMQRFTGYYI